MTHTSDHTPADADSPRRFSARTAWTNPSDHLIERLSEGIRDFPDFPQEGVLFRDLSGVFADPCLLRQAAAHMAIAFEGQFSSVLAVESRGFVLGTALAQFGTCSLVLARKIGKLPGPVHRATYEFEYGATALEMQQGALRPDERVLIIDDVLATGGTLGAASALVSRAGAKVIGFTVLLELAMLGGRRTLAPHPVYSLLTT